MRDVMRALRYVHQLHEKMATPGISVATKRALQAQSDRFWATVVKACEDAAQQDEFSTQYELDAAKAEAREVRKNGSRWVGEEDAESWLNRLHERIEELEARLFDYRLADGLDCESFSIEQEAAHFGIENMEE